jgi:hypothetical protein
MPNTLGVSGVWFFSAFESNDGKLWYDPMLNPLEANCSAFARQRSFTSHTPNPAGNPNPFCTEKNTVSTLS